MTKRTPTCSTGTPGTKQQQRTRCRRRNKHHRPCPLLPSLLPTAATIGGNNSGCGSNDDDDYDDDGVVPTNNNHRHTLVRSRKMARKITTLFHKYTHQKEELIQSLQQQQQKQQSSSSFSNTDCDCVVTAGDDQQYHGDNTQDQCRSTVVQGQIDELDQKIQQIGGRPVYQRASQISTSYHSTSKWVLGYLAQNGWLYGIRSTNKDDDSAIINNNANNNANNNHDDNYTANTDLNDNDATTKINFQNNNNITDNYRNSKPKDIGISLVSKKRKRNGTVRRTTRLLEIGAINTELLDAAEAVVMSTDDSYTQNDNDNSSIRSNRHSMSLPQVRNKKKYNLHVRAIDIHSMYPNRIEEINFMNLCTTTTIPYDVIVCSMVLNCVPTPIGRGSMLLKLYQHTNPNGGLVFLIIPKTCVTLSPYMDEKHFIELLSTGIGFELIQHTKTSPKLLYYILQRNSVDIDHSNTLSSTVTTTATTSTATISPTPTDDNPATTSTNNKKKKKQMKQSRASIFYTDPPKIIRRGKKYRNPFAIVLPENMM